MILISVFARETTDFVRTKVDVYLELLKMEKPMDK